MRYEPIALLRRSELICKRLRSEDREEMLGEALFDPPLDPEPYASQVEPAIETVRQSFEVHQRSRRRVDTLRRRRGQGRSPGSGG